MKDGRTHSTAEHAVDGDRRDCRVTLHGADVGDTTTIIETAIAATEQVEDAQANVDDPQALDEIVGDKGYHSNQTLMRPGRRASGPTCPSRTGGDVIGRLPRPRYAAARIERSFAHLRHAGCGARICAATRTS